MARNTSVSLGDHFDAFISAGVAAGRYKNASEVIRAGLRLLEDEENKTAVLKAALQEGLDSGTAHDFHPADHLHMLKAARKSNG